MKLTKKRRFDEAPVGLTLSTVSKAFDGEIVLDRLSAEFTPTGIYAVMGPSGGGKTTLLRIIAGLSEPDGGEVTGGGSGRCAFAFQEYRLFDRASALENVICVMKGEREVCIAQAKQMLDELGLPSEAQHKRVELLSGGMRQRVSLARAFCSGLPIVLLDEPDKELDPELRRRLADVVRRQGRSKLIIAVTHSDEFADMISDNRLIIDKKEA